MTENRRLMMFVLIALGIHVLVLVQMRGPRTFVSFPAPPLVLRWAPPTQERIVEEPPGVVETRLPDKRPVRLAQSSPKLASSSRQPGPGDPDGAKTREAGEPAYPTHRDAVELIESAREIVHKMVRESAHREGSRVQDERSFQPELDRALKKTGAGEVRMAGGLIRVTTPSGRVYCMQAPPDFARGGLADVTSVPTNCP